MAIYMFRQRFDYSEFGKMVEKRALPDAWQGHWGYDVVDAYGALAPLQGEEISLPALVSQQVAATYIASQGSVPQWFADGVGRTIASRVAPKDLRIRQWDDRVPVALASSAAPDSFLSAKMPPEDSAVLSYSFVKFLMTRPANFAMLLTAVQQGEKFETALAKSYNANLQGLTAAWAGRTLSKRR